MHKPILFLDIDDVLNCKDGDAIAKEKYPKEADLLREDLIANKEHMYKFWHQNAVDSLKIILDEIEPQIYIHSTWKFHFTKKEFKQFLGLLNNEWVISLQNDSVVELIY